MGWIGSSTWTLLAAACLSVSAAHAQAGVPRDQDENDAATSSTTGAQIVEGPDGFQLVEHGLWERPSSVKPAPGEAAADGGDPPPPAPVRRSRVWISNFRRAIYLPHIIAAEAKYALPAGLLDAVIFAESRYDPLAISSVGAVGLGQLMPGTARELGVRNRFDPLENLDGAARYLRNMLDRFGMVHLALAAYNAGPAAVERARGIPQNLETPAYVREVLQRWRF
jgi:soluble lytic murein transglycosylase-like protein